MLMYIQARKCFFLPDETNTSDTTAFENFHFTIEVMATYNYFNEQQNVGQVSNYNGVKIKQHCFWLSE